MQVYSKMFCAAADAAGMTPAAFASAVRGCLKRTMKCRDTNGGDTVGRIFSSKVVNAINNFSRQLVSRH